VHFEKGDYDTAIADCDKAVERGRELRADYALIARALARKGNALAKQDKLEEAVAVYNKSLMEHRTADTLKRLNETEKKLKVCERAVSCTTLAVACHREWFCPFRLSLVHKFAFAFAVLGEARC